ncbi:MAG TPA: UDP-N-acetylglucosamine 4,6-dehydratase (inverting) [Candidatus Omnitrophota bacterium]|nr:UDP-N-acetylglucosamine 4,6-dehydratase (inverting) [Candidatus Omnitrophota bacterium]
MKKDFLEGKTILITGGTGSFGKKFTEMVLKKFKPKKLIIYSRDEMKQWQMHQDFEKLDKNKVLRYFVGDVRDIPRLQLALSGVDYVVHAAALKIITTAEYNPFECIKTNVLGAMNLIQCSLEAKVKKVVALSTDKASNPVNLYGATKLCSDKLFVAGNAYSGANGTCFSVVRYGNVMGSRGSIIPLFLSLKKEKSIPVTDIRMTRFMITLEAGVELVWRALQEAIGGEIFVPKIPSMKITDVAKAIAPKAKLKIIGIRPGEKIHESMISEEDARTTYEYSDCYKILPAIYDWHHCAQRIGEGKKCTEGFTYSSGDNHQWMSASALQSWIKKEYKND